MACSPSFSSALRSGGFLACGAEALARCSTGFFLRQRDPTSRWRPGAPLLPGLWYCAGGDLLSARLPGERFTRGRHWCLAGTRRRQRVDYGYWYAPEGRDEAQQAAFFAVEAAPQALESLFCERLSGCPLRRAWITPGPRRRTLRLSLQPRTGTAGAGRRRAFRPELPPAMP